MAKLPAPTWLFTALASIALAASACSSGSEPAAAGAGSPESPSATPSRLSEGSRLGAAPSPTLRATPVSPTPRSGSIQVPAAVASSSPEPQVRVTYSSVNVRGGPGLEHKPVAYLYQDDVVRVIDANAQATWYQVKLPDGRLGWVAASVVETLSEFTVADLATPTPTPTATAGPGTPRLRVSIRAAYIRSGPGTDFEVVGILAEGTLVRVLARDGRGSWYQVLLDNGARVWIGAEVTEPYGSWSEDGVPLVEALSAPAATEG